jgi:transcription antitermination protein NusB
MNEERSAARLAAVQALYQMDVAAKGVIDVLAEFETFWIGQTVEDLEFPEADKDLFRRIVTGVVERQTEIDRGLESVLVEGWPLARLEAVLRAVLRAGAFEILFCEDIPKAVSITEYVDVAHLFFEDEQPALVNGVLDKIATHKSGHSGERREKKA